MIRKDLNHLLDELMVFYTQNEFAVEVEEAKALFFKVAGVPDELSDQFDTKMQQFTDWYLFRRPLQKHPVHAGRTPIETLVFLHQSIEEKYIYLKQPLIDSVHSFFEIKKIKDEEVVLQDLFYSCKRIVKDQSLSLGYFKDKIFEARLVEVDNSFIFSSLFCFHPEEARPFIRKKVKLVKALKKKRPDHFLLRKEDVMHDIYYLRCKLDQFSQMKTKEIYNDQFHEKFKKYESLSLK